MMYYFSRILLTAAVAILRLRIYVSKEKVQKLNLEGVHLNSICKPEAIDREI